MKVLYCIGNSVIAGEGFFEEEGISAITADEDELEQALLLTPESFPMLVDVGKEVDLENIRAICMEITAKIIVEGEKSLGYKPG